MTEREANAILVEVREIRREMSRDREEFREDLADIKEQTTAHNGRMTALEAWKIRQEARLESRNGWLRWIVPVVTGTLSGSAVVVVSLLLTGSL